MFTLKLLPRVTFPTDITISKSTHDKLIRKSNQRIGSTLTPTSDPNRMSLSSESLDSSIETKIQVLLEQKEMLGNQVLFIYIFLMFSKMRNAKVRGETDDVESLVENLHEIDVELALLRGA